MAEPGTERYELKFVASDSDYHYLIAWLKQQSSALRPAFPERKVNNVYFDTIDYQSYRVSHEGSSSRAKVRYRWYGDALAPDAGQLEIKVRTNRLGQKHTFRINTLIGQERRWRAIRNHLRLGVSPEWSELFLRHDRPTILNRYLRNYWASVDGRLRVTLDKDHIVLDQRYRSTVNLDRIARRSHVVILEAKGSAAERERMSEFVRTLDLPLVRYSKYCEALESVMAS